MRSRAVCIGVQKVGAQRAICAGQSCPTIKSAQSPAHTVTAVTPRLYSAPPRSCSARTTLTARRKNLYLPVALPVDNASSETWPQSKTALYGLILPILPTLYSVNQRLPSGPVVMYSGPLPLVGVTNSVIVPEGVTLPILPALCSANQRLPSGPVVMKYGWLLLEEVANSVMVPEGVTLPIFPMLSFAPHRVSVGAGGGYRGA